MNMRFESKLATAMTALTLSACGAVSSLDAPPSGGDAELTSISIGLPDREAMKSKVPDIESKMNGYRLKVSPVDAGCKDATKIDQTDDYKSALSLGAALQQGCDYDVSLALGHRGQASTGTASKIAYEGKVQALIKNSCTGCHSSAGGQSPDLSSYALASAKGARILARVSAGTMPTSGALPAADQALIASWAKDGYLETAPASAAASGGDLGDIYYSNDTPLRIKKEDIAGKASLNVALQLQLQAAGRALGLGGISTAQPGSGGGPNAGGGNVPPVQPAQPVSTLPADRDFKMTDGDGNAESLSKLMGSKPYMLIDFSTSTCGYCLQRAGEMNRDTDLQKKLESKSCSHATIVPEGDLSNWVRATGDNNFTSKHSYAATTARIGQLVESFGITFGGTPTFILIDAKGKVVKTEFGIPTDTIDSVCK